MSTSHWIMMQRTLFYTALTRASGRCFIVGSTAAMAQAVNNNAVRRRYTMLGDLVREYIDNPR
jgi:exodeoxyribonuclease V alpha subunit